MTARILCPDDHPDRWWRGDPAKRGEAFASINRALRDEVLPDPKVRRVIVMVGTAGAGKSTTAAELAKVDWQQGTVIVDACHDTPAARISLVKRIRAAGKMAVAVVLRTPAAECVRRDAERPVGRKVGRQIIERKARELRLHPPTKAEGWSSIVFLDPTAPNGEESGRSEDLGMLVMAGEAMRRGQQAHGGVR